jgi:hypothetical protein
MGWSNFIKAVGKGTVRLTEGAGRSVGTVAKGVGEGMGATAKGLGGWKGVVGTGAVIGAVRSEDGLTGVASDVLFGQGGADKVKEHGVAGEVLDIAIGEKGKQAVNTATEMASHQISDIQQQMTPVTPYGDTVQQPMYAAQDGFGSFMSNPLNMGGNFLSNLMNGNVSAMSMAAMIASSFLIFGRFGLFTKALGALLGLHTIGRNSQPVYTQRMPVYSQAPVAQTPIQPEPEIVERSRGFGR